MAESISIKDTIVIRSRPDALFRMALDPRRRTRWDPNFAGGSLEGESLGSGSVARYKLARRLLGLSFSARIGQYQAPTRGGWESLKGFGPLDSLAQQWGFKPIPGGTEVTLATRATVHFRWLAGPVERVLRNMSGQSLLELQRAVDAQGAQLMEDTAKEYQRQQKALDKQARQARKAKK